MSPRYLLDTNAVSDLVRNPGGRIARRIAELGSPEVCTSIVVAAELRYGAVKLGSARLAAQLETILGALEIIALDEPVDRVYGEVRATLERNGRPIGSNDLLISAQALAIGCTLVTANEREFSRIEGLPVENWLSAAPN